jgi:hypothetical protein
MLLLLRMWPLWLSDYGASAPNVGLGSDNPAAGSSPRSGNTLKLVYMFMFNLS